MEYAADDINVGYMSCLLFMNSEGTLVDKIGEIKEIKPDNHSGGVEFVAVLKTMETLVSITMNLNGNRHLRSRTESMMPFSRIRVFDRCSGVSVPF